MADVEEIIDYIKSLKKGFDKELFQSKIEELAHAVETTGLDYDDFHTLFKVWLNLQIPITKWTNLGACFVPSGKVEERTVEYSFRWILANSDKQTSFSRIGFVLDWLTAAMDCDCIDMKALDMGYELFYIMLTYEVLTVHAVKLVYMLTKPSDVTRRRVLELLDYAKKREAKKNMYRQLQVLLGLFKSYKPACVPEDIPAMSIHTAFKKINVSLLARFRRNQERRNYLSEERHHLMWINPLNSDRGRNKKVEPLVPCLEFLNVGYQQNTDNQPQKNYFDFSDAASLLHHSVSSQLPRPARLRALLCSSPGLALLALAADSDHAFLAHDHKHDLHVCDAASLLHHSVSSQLPRPARLRALLCSSPGLALLALAADSDHAFLAHDHKHDLHVCFLDGSPHSYAEKADLLRRLAMFQRTLCQGLPVVTRTLAQLLPLWDETQYWAEILELVEWVSVESPEQVQTIVAALSRVYLRAQPLEQCAILKCLTNMYANLAYGSTRTRQHYMSMKPSEANFSYVLPLVASSISQMCNKALQISPEDMRVLHSVSQASLCMARAERSRSALALPPPGALALALPLLAVSAALLDDMAHLMMLYKKIFVAMKQADNFKKEQYSEHLQTLKAYTCDLINCLCGEEALRGRANGLVFTRLHPQLVGKMYSLMPDVDSKLSLRNHIALAPYTYMQLEAIDHRDADNKLWLDTVIDEEFTHLSDFLRKAVPEWRSV